MEMNQYKILTENADAAPIPAGASASAADRVGAMISPGGSPTLRPMEVSSSTLPPMMPHLHQPSHMPTESATAELILSLERDISSSSSSFDEDEIDYSICSVSNNGHYIPSPPALSSNKSNMIHPDGTICDPLFELEDGYSCQQHLDKRCVSPVSCEMNVDDVDTISEGGFFHFQSSC